MNLLIILRFHETKLASGLGIIFPVLLTNASQTRPPPPPGRIMRPAATFVYYVY
jgi:hypothetical protein